MCVFVFLFVFRACDKPGVCVCVGASAGVRAALVGGGRSRVLEG